MSNGSFGELFKTLRRERAGQSLREFCAEHGFDPGNLSKLERGKLPPPRSRDILERYASALGLEEGSDDWYRFFDLAAASRGEIPEDLLENRELASRLPALFRTLRGERVDGERLERLIDVLRES